MWDASCTVCGADYGEAELPAGYDPNGMTKEDAQAVGGRIQFYFDEQPEGCDRPWHLDELVGDYEYTSCNSRKYTKVCKICGRIESGEEAVSGHGSGWHIWPDQDTVPGKAPTCTEAGRKPSKTCTRCGADYLSFTSGPWGDAGYIAPLGHSYDANGVCIRCGASEDEDLADQRSPLAGVPDVQTQGTDLRPAILLAMGTVVLALYVIELVSRKRERAKK